MKVSALQETSTEVFLFMTGLRF